MIRRAYLLLILGAFVACDDRSEPETSDDAPTSEFGECSLELGGSVPIRELLSETLPSDDKELSLALCDRACEQAVDKIAENTGAHEVLACEVNLELVRSCEENAFGGAAGAAGAPGSDCDGWRDAVHANCLIEYVCHRQ